MKVQGRSIERYVGTFRFRRFHEENGSGPVEHVEASLEEISIQVRALPPGWWRDAYTMLPEPQPPEGKKHTKDPATGRFQTEPDDKDPTYLAERDRWQQLLNAKKILDATVEGVEWDTHLSQPYKRAELEGVAEEIAEAFSAGEVNQWVMTIDAIGAVGGADIELAEQSFFRQGLGLRGVPAPEEPEEVGPGADDDSVSRADDLQGDGVVTH